MNKYGFISSLLTIILFIFQFFPLGIYYGQGEFIYSWIFRYLDSGSNPWLTSFVQIPMELFYFKNDKIYLWGVVSGGDLLLWYQVHLLTFIFLTILGLITIILALIGCGKENKAGKSLIKINFYVLLSILLYSIIGIPLYSSEIIGTNLGFFDIFFHLDFGFYILLIDLIFALIAYIKHPIQE